MNRFVSGISTLLRISCPTAHLDRHASGMLTTVGIGWGHVQDANTGHIITAGIPRLTDAVALGVHPSALHPLSVR